MAWVFSEDGCHALNLDCYEEAKISQVGKSGKWAVEFGRRYEPHPEDKLDWFCLGMFDTKEQAEEFLSEAFLYARGGGWSR